MKRIGWVTDLHLEFLSKAGRSTFIDDLANRELELLLVGGDTAKASLSRREYVHPGGKESS